MQAYRFPRNSHIIFPAFLTIVAIVVGAATTRCGIGISPDSITYMSTTHPGIHAPLYAWVLAAIKGLGADVVNSARLLNICLLTANTLLAWFALHRATHSPTASFLGSLLVLTSNQFLCCHVYALSDPLFLFFTFIGILYLSRYLETKIQIFLFASGVSAALALMTRYAGAPLIGAGLLSILLFSQKGIKERLRDGLIFGGISSAPMAIWLVVTKIAYGSTSTGRELAFLGDAVAGRTLAGVQELARFLLPTMVPIIIRMILLIIVVSSLAMLMIAYINADRKRRDRDGQLKEFDKLPHVLGLFIICYLSFMFATILIQPFMPINARLLVPVYVAAVLLSVLLVQKVLMPRQGLRSLHILILLFAIGLALSNSVRSTKWVAKWYQDGIGLSSLAWKTSELIECVNALHSSVPIYSNGHFAIFFLTGRRVHSLPKKIYPITGKPNTSYLLDYAAMREDLEKREGVLVFFNTIGQRQYRVSVEELKTQLPLRLTVTAADGVIYQIER